MPISGDVYMCNKSMGTNNWYTFTCAYFALTTEGLTPGFTPYNMQEYAINHGIIFC